MWLRESGLDLESWVTLHQCAHVLKNLQQTSIPWEIQAGWRAEPSVVLSQCLGRVAATSSPSPPHLPLWLDHRMLLLLVPMETRNCVGYGEGCRLPAFAECMPLLQPLTP